MYTAVKPIHEHCIYTVSVIIHED